VSPMAIDIHGGLDPVELRSLGIDPARMVDFSASINPLGTPAVVRKAVASVDYAAYPDRRCHALRQALSERLEVQPGQILVGNGSTELIHLLARVCLGRNVQAFLFIPTFGEYEASCRAIGAAASVAVAAEAAGFRWDLDRAREDIRVQHPRLVFLCNPNNPTGAYLSRAEVEEIARAVGDNGLLVLDEAYVSFTEGAWDSRPLLGLGNVVLLRSMTKDYALAGLRLGYMLAPPPILEKTSGLQPSWSVNGAAQAAGLAALETRSYLDRAREIVKESRAYLEREFSALGLAVVPSAANFLLVKVGDAASLRLKLLRKGVCVRDCTSFGLPQHIRVGVRKLGECRRLVAAVEEALAHE